MSSFKRSFTILNQSKLPICPRLSVLDNVGASPIKLKPSSLNTTENVKLPAAGGFQNFQGRYKFLWNCRNWASAERQSLIRQGSLKPHYRYNLEFYHHIFTTHHPFLVSNNWLLPRKATASHTVSCSPHNLPTVQQPVSPSAVPGDGTCLNWKMTSNSIPPFAEELIRSSVSSGSSMIRSTEERLT